MSGKKPRAEDGPKESPRCWSILCKNNLPQDRNVRRANVLARWKRDYINSRGKVFDVGPNELAHNVWHRVGAYDYAYLKGNFPSVRAIDANAISFCLPGT